ncbi:MAG: DNA-protecting protein DprA [Candidatus Eisenbacteria bacterium]|nr:DNA-protecting protein DprA [Candidatus Eisenbacteria bacterium]
MTPGALDARVLYARFPAAADPAAAWRGAAPAERARAAGDARHLAALGVRALLPGEPGWPRGFSDLRDPPRVVFACGRLPERGRAVAIVGSRAASPYGMAQAQALACDLARLGYTVVSGLARGIDAAAHRGALAVGGASVGVLAGGLDEVTPHYHRELARELCVRGGLVSEIPAGAPLHRGGFVERNRLIAALSSAVVVVEAAARSGALSTAAAARRLGRALFAVPGDVDRPTARGTHALLRAGARLCERAGDVVQALEAPGGSGETPESRLLAALGPTAPTAESLAQEAQLALDQALGVLLALEWSGAAEALPGQRWRRARP